MTLCVRVNLTCSAKHRTSERPATSERRPVGERRAGPTRRPTGEPGIPYGPWVWTGWKDVGINSVGYTTQPNIFIYVYIYTYKYLYINKCIYINIDIYK